CLTLRPPPEPTLFPYTTLFRSPAMTTWKQTSAICKAPYAVALPRAERADQQATGSFRLADMAQHTTAQSPVGQKAALDMKRLGRSEEHTSELQSRSDLVCRLLL